MKPFGGSERNPQNTEATPQLVQLKSEGDVGGFLSSLHLKHHLKSIGDPRADDMYHEIALCGGGVMGVLHAEALERLIAEGLLEDVDAFIGISTGADAELLAFGSDHPRRGAFYHEVIVPQRIVDGSPQAIARRRVLDERLIGFLRQHTNTDKVQTAPMPLYAVVTDPDGNQVITDLRKQPDPVLWAAGSSAIPGVVTPAGIDLDHGWGRDKGFDGGVMGINPQVPDVIKPQAKQRYRLIIDPRMSEQGIDPLIIKYLTMDPRLRPYRGLRRAILHMNEKALADIAAIRQQIAHGEHVGMITFADLAKGLHALCTDRNLLKNAQHHIGISLRQLFDQYINPQTLQANIQTLEGLPAA